MILRLPGEVYFAPGPLELWLVRISLHILKDIYILLKGDETKTKCQSWDNIIKVLFFFPVLLEGIYINTEKHHRSCGDQAVFF